jgi:methyltransferase (TIGR00027 family)
VALESKGTRMSRSTAEGAAALRAVGASLRDPALRGPDHMAVQMISPGLTLASLMKVPGFGRIAPALMERMLPGALWFEVARTKYMDEVFLDEVASGARQAIILGAGLDTRAYRFEAELKDIEVFEVDHPITAGLKRSRLEDVLGGRPDHVNYVTIDFNKEDLAQVLDAAGFDRSRRSVVVWSGVAPYLEPAGVDATLAWMASQAPASVIVFDYCWRGLVDGDFDHIDGARLLRERVSAQGEPLLWGIPDHQTEAYLAERGLEIVEDLALTDAARYVTASDGTVPTELWDFGGIVRARVPG